MNTIPPQDIASLAMSGLEDVEQGLQEHEECVLMVADICYHFLFCSLERSLPHWDLWEFPPAQAPAHSLLSTPPCCICTSQATLFLSWGNFFFLDSHFTLCFFFFSSYSFPFSVFFLANPSPLIKNQTSQLEEILKSVVCAVSNSTEDSACFSFCLTAVLCLWLEASSSKGSVFIPSHSGWIGVTSEVLGYSKGWEIILDFSNENNWFCLWLHRKYFKTIHFIDFRETYILKTQ